MTCRWYRRSVARAADAASVGSDARAYRHVRSCERCQRILADQDLIAAELRKLELPEPSSGSLWRRVERHLDRPGTHDARDRPAKGRVRYAVRWALNDSPTWAVAIVAVLALLGMWQARDWANRARPVAQREAPGVASSTDQAAKSPAPRRRELAMVPLNLDVGTYVQEVGLSPEPDEFWTAYRARELSTEAPYRGLDFEPVVPERLPHGFRRVDSKLLRDACCETLQVRYESADRWLDIFQCHDDHPIEFGQALVDRRDVDGIVCTAFDWDGGRIRGRSFLLGELSVVAVGNLSDEVLDDVVTDLGRR